MEIIKKINLISTISYVFFVMTVILLFAMTATIIGLSIGILIPLFSSIYGFRLLKKYNVKEDYRTFKTKIGLTATFVQSPFMFIMGIFPFMPIGSKILIGMLGGIMISTIVIGTAYLMHLQIKLRTMYKTKK